MKVLIVGVMVSALGLGFVAGRLTAPVDAHGNHSGTQARLAQLQAPNDPRELYPLVPGPGQDGSQDPAPSAPNGQQGEQGDCPVLLLKDGQLYEMRPGQEQPGPGEQGDGQPGGDNELFPLQPYRGPSPIPGLPLTPTPDVRT